MLWNARANTRTLREWTGTGGVGEEGEGTSSPQQCHLWVQGIFRLVGGFACVSRCAPRFLTTVCVLLYTAWPGTTPNTLCTSNGDVMVDARRCTYYPVSLGRRSLVMMDRGLVRRPKFSLASFSLDFRFCKHLFFHARPSSAWVGPHTKVLHVAQYKYRTTS